jgi:hypothetical protein
MTIKPNYDAVEEIDVVEKNELLAARPDQFYALLSKQWRNLYPLKKA